MGIRTQIKPGFYRTPSGYEQRGGGVRYQEPFTVTQYGSLRAAKKVAETALANFIKKYPAAKQVVPEGAETFLKTYLKKRGLKNWTDLSRGQKSNFIDKVWPKYEAQQAKIKGMIPASEMAERLGISSENLANLRKTNSIFHKKLTELVGKPINLVGAAGGTLAERGEYIYYNPMKSKDLKIAQKYFPSI